MLTFVVGQKIVINNSINQILLLRRSSKVGLGGRWSFPGGGLDEGENPEQGIVREIMEETQLLVDYPKPFYVRTYKHDEENILIIAYQGYLRAGEVILNDEHDDYKWCSKEEALLLDLTPDAKDILNHWHVYKGRPQSKASDVLDLFKVAEKLEIKIWLDGGWGVDALLEKQTRDHDDIDIVIRQKDDKKLRNYLVENGYQEIVRDDSSAWNYVLGDGFGHIVDFHVIDINKQGNGMYGLPENGDYYPADSLKARGKVLGKSVRCLSPEYQVSSHTGYKLREQDFLDVKALCEKFNIRLPEEYTKVAK